MKQIEELFRQYTGRTVADIYELPSSGSNRRYFRVSGGGRTLIGAKGTSIDENKAFIEIDRHFHAKGLAVPKVLAVSDDMQFYLQEDLGDITLFNRISQGRESGNYSEYEISLLKKTISALPKIQFEGGRGLDYSICFPQPEFDERMISFDLNYFKYCFLKATGLEFSEIKLHEDFSRFSADLLSTVSGDTFLYRDFQARNVMLVNDEPYFIDFQGGRRGPFYYDLASFVWQARANYSQQVKEILINCYRDALSRYVKVPNEEFYRRLRMFVLFRTMQVLGAYGFRGYFERKKHFIDSIPPAMQNLRELRRGLPGLEVEKEAASHAAADGGVAQGHAEARAARADEGAELFGVAEADVTRAHDGARRRAAALRGRDFRSRLRLLCEVERHVVPDRAPVDAFRNAALFKPEALVEGNEALLAGEHHAAAPFPFGFLDEGGEQVARDAAPTPVGMNGETEDALPGPLRIMQSGVFIETVFDRFAVRHHPVDKPHGRTVVFGDQESFRKGLQTGLETLAARSFGGRKARRLDRRQGVEVAKRRSAQ